MALCPYCYKHFLGKDVAFRCTNVRCTGDEVDKNYEAYLQFRAEDAPNIDLEGAPLMKKVYTPRRTVMDKFAGANAMKRSAPCPVCGEDSSKRVCPHCHCELPKNFNNDDPVVIGVLGDRYVGKSNYIAVLIHELENRLVAEELDGFMSTSITDVRDRYNKYYHNRIYQKHMVAEGTPEAIGTDEGRDRYKPLIFDLNIGEKTICLVIYDIAGEDTQHPDYLKRVAPYLPYMDGLIYLFDPMYINAFYKNVESKFPEELRTATQITPEILANYAMTGTITRIHDICAENPKLKRMPVAIAVSKSDVIEKLNGALDANSICRRQSRLYKDGKYNIEEQQLVDDDVKAFLAHYAVGNFMNFVEKKFGKSTYTMFSSFGQSPTLVGSDLKVDIPQPKRIEDALYYILHEIKVLQ